MFNRQTVQLTLQGKPVKIHLVSTGAVSVKKKFRETKRTGLVAMLEFIIDKHFTEWLPIWVLIIEHPEGIFVIDTGENSDINKPNYFKSSGFFANWFDTTQFKFKVNRQDEIDVHLHALNIPVEKIKAVVLTHLHLDHTDGLKYFPHTEILVNRSEWDKPFGDLPKLYPSWFKPSFVNLTERYDVFEKVQYLSKAKDLLLIHTPGHTYGHCSVLLRADNYNLFFAADVCYSQQQLIENKYAGNNASHKLAQNTYDKIRTFARKHKLIFLPSHEEEAATRLQQLQPMYEAG